MIIRVYPDAPEATKKSKELSVVTSWPFMIFFGSMLWLLLIAVIFGHNFNLFFILVSFIPLYFVFYLIRKWAWRRLDEQAKKEAERNRALGKSYSVDEQFRQMSEELIAQKERSDRQSAKFSFWVFKIMGTLFCLLALYSFPFRVIDVNKISGDEILSEQTCYIERLYILDAYAKVEEGKRTFYLALFQDKNGRNFFVSFDPWANYFDLLKSSRVKTLIDEYTHDNNSKIRSLNLSVYVEMYSIDKEGDKYKQLPSYFSYACEKYSSIINAKMLRMNARYICSGDESIVLHSLTVDRLMILLFGGFFLWIGRKVSKIN